MNESSETESSGKAASLFGGYHSSPGVFDESVSAPGTPRAHWQNFLTSFEKLGREELAVRWDNGRRMIREHGVTYTKSRHY